MAQTTSLGSVDAILMASGFSRRFGSEDKLLQPFCGTPLARRALELALSFGGFSHIWFVYASAAVGRLAAGCPGITLIHNQNPERGSCESIRLGVLSSSADHYLFMQCDQPLLDAPTLQAILAQRAPGRIIVPVHDGTEGSPSLFSATFRPQLLALADNQSARSIRAEHPDDVTRVPIDSPFPLADVDTPQELARLQAIANGG